MNSLEKYKKESNANYFEKFGSHFLLESISNDTILKDGDIILQNKGSLKLSNYDKGLKNLKNKYKVKILRDDLDSRYLFWLFEQKFFQEYMLTLHKGSVIFYITKKDILSLDIPFFKGRVIPEYTKENIERSYFIVRHYQKYKKLIKDGEDFLAIIIAGVILEAILCEKLRFNKFPKAYMKGLGCQPLFQYCVAGDFISNKDYANIFQNISEARNLVHYAKQESQKDIDEINEMIKKGIASFDSIYSKYIKNELFIK
jgi:hypothetical protein